MKDSLSMRQPEVKKRIILRHSRVFDLTVENVTLPNGVNIDMEIIRHPGASAIVALTASQEVIMLKQYRHAVGGSLWEIPAGTFSENEAPLECARRELIEETGYEATTWQPLGPLTPVPSYSDERIHLFLAQNLKPVLQSLDEDEIIEVHLLPISQVVSMIMEGEIEDAKTIAALFRALHKLEVVKQ